MICPNCGKEIKENQKFCTYCVIELKQHSEDTESQDETLQNASYLSYDTICVYDPDGKPHKPLLEIAKENELKLRQEKLEKIRLEEQKTNQEVADELF